MNAQRKTFPLRATAAAAQAVLAAMAWVPAAHALDLADPAVAALVEQANTIELGAGSLSSGSFKANEYNGLSTKGGFAIGNFDLRGGGAIGSDDPSRWRILGRDLGTESRSLSAQYSLQGSYKVNLGYDELRRNRSDSYQTPLLGAGTNVLTLPSTWMVPLVPRLSGSSANARGLSPDVTASNGLVSGVPTAPTTAQAATAAAIQGADIPLFQSVDLYTKRTRFDLGITIDVDKQWQVGMSVRHEDKVGMKPMGTVTRVTGGDISTIIPDLINQSTDLLNLSLRYHLDKLTLQAAYDGSEFTNSVPSMTWSNWALPSSSQTMSSAPSNQVHQFSLNGSYAFAKNTRLVATATYGRNTQNDAFLTATYTPLVPVSSLNGLVVNKTANVKFTTQPVRDLTVVAGYKMDQRDNRTAVNTYGFYDAGDAAASGTSPFSAYYPGATLAPNVNLNANRPYSRKLQQAVAEADYRLSETQGAKAALESQKTDYYCTGSWIACADASTAKENTLRLEWRVTASTGLRGRASVAHSQRTVDYNEDAWLAVVPAANLSPTGAPSGSSAYSTMTSLGLTGYGPILGLNPLPTAGSAQAYFFANNNALSNALYSNGNRISELPGMRRYNMADRTRDKVRASFDWQATDAFSLQAGLDVNRDKYSHSVYGLQKSNSYALNLDGTYILTELATLNVFATHEAQTADAAGNSYTANSTATAVNTFTAISGGCFATIALRNASNKIDPCLNWTTSMRDKVDTVGINFTRAGLYGSKLDFNAGLSYSRARSTNDVAGGNYANNPLAVTGAPAGTIAAYYIAATPLPEVTTNTIDAKVGGKYALTKESAVRVGYRYQHMTATDWAYDGMQYGGLAGVLPSNETAPNFTVHTVMVSYIYSF